MAYVALSGPVYLDTNIFIYALEGYPAFRPALSGQTVGAKALQVKFYRFANHRFSFLDRLTGSSTPR